MELVVLSRGVVTPSQVTGVSRNDTTRRGPRRLWCLSAVAQGLPQPGERFAAIRCAGVAPLVEHILRKGAVGGSGPFTGTTSPKISERSLPAI